MIRNTLTETDAKALNTVARLLKQQKLLDDDGIECLMEDAILALQDGPPQEQRSFTGSFRAAKFIVEYDHDELELDVTYAFKNQAIIILRARREGR